MDRQVLKGMVLMLKQVLSELEAEVYSDEDDGYPDQRSNSKVAP